MLAMFRLPRPTDAPQLGKGHINTSPPWLMGLEGVLSRYWVKRRYNSVQKRKTTSQSTEEYKMGTNYNYLLKMSSREMR